MLNAFQQTPYLAANTQWFHDRAKAGSKDGSLTPLEQRVVHAEMRDFRADQREARADGKVTGAERKELWSEAAHINRDIFSLRRQFGYHTATEGAGFDLDPPSS